MYKTIYLDAPSVGSLEKKYLMRAIDSGYVSTAGPFVSEFEDKCRRFVGAAASCATQSGTAAIHMALYELGIGKGDEVIVPAVTFVASVNPVLYVGASPSFADIDPNTWNIDPDDIERRITKKTKAIIPVHLYGNPCDMVRIMKIAKKHDLKVIEDATESLGATYRKRHTGTFGDLGCLSFNGNKTITTGGGGMVVGRDKKNTGHIRFLVNQAKDKKDPMYHTEVGFNYRMTNIEAALGLAQLARIDTLLRKKKEINSIYREELGGMSAIRFQDEYEYAKSSCWLTCVTVDSKNRVKTLQDKLKRCGIQTRRVFMPLYEFPPYRKYKKVDYLNSRSLHESGLCLPSSVLISKDDVYHVCKILKGIIR